MREPKYKLNKVDDARWHELLTRDCAQYPVKAGDPVIPDPKYPPLTPKEQAEFERLQRKRTRKIYGHPKVKLQLEAQRRHDRKLRRLVNKLKKLTNEIKPQS